MSSRDEPPSYPPPSDEHPLRGRVLDALIDGGLAPVLDDDGDIAFSSREQKLFIRCTDEPVPMMRLFGQWRITPPASTSELVRLRAANQVTGRLTVVKASVHEDLLVVAAEMVIGADLPLQPLMLGTVDGVLTGVTMWHELATESG